VKSMMGNNLKQLGRRQSIMQIRREYIDIHLMNNDRFACPNGDLLESLHSCLPSFLMKLCGAVVSTMARYNIHLIDEQHVEKNYSDQLSI